MLYIRSSCTSYFLAFWSILEISRNSRTFEESWRFRYFHIWEFSQILKRGSFDLFISSSIIFFQYQKYKRGNNMTFPKLRKNEDLIHRSNFVFQCLFVFLWIGKNARFRKLHFRSVEKFILFESFLGVGENLL